MSTMAEGDTAGEEQDLAAPEVGRNGPRPAGDGLPEEAEDVRQATGLAVAAAGAAVLGFVSFFRLRAGWDQSRARVLRRVFGVQVESLAGVVLGALALNRLRDAKDRRGIPFAAGGVVVGTSTLVRVFAWLRSG